MRNWNLTLQTCVRLMASRLTTSEMARQRWMVYGALGKEGVVFVRPDSGEKTFQAQLVDAQDLDEFVRVHEKEQHDMVLVSTPKNIWWEGRFVCHQNEIIAHSTYKLQGQRTLVPSVPKGATECCQRALERNYRPDTVFCVDVCGIDHSSEFFVLELNAFASSGLYACNKEIIVERVSQIASS